jgi:PhoPQ-activated pathogenicity-related protein
MNTAYKAGLLGLSILAFGCAPATEAPATTAEAAPVGDFPREIAASERTALDDYMDKPEAVYGWTKVSEIAGEGYTADVLELTSQTWRTEADVDHPVWKHWLTVVRPDTVTTDTSLLYITGGSNDNEAPTEAPENIVPIALATGSIVSELRMVPNQPLHYSDSPDVARYEDDSIAYTWVKHTKTKDDEWLIRLAMVKSGVKAMDAIQEFTATEEGGGHAIAEFVVSGASKRGWTTWLVGAVDERVSAIIPLVIDALNTNALAKHHYEVLGFFAPALADYVHHGLIPHMEGDPDYQAVLDIEDPYEYFERGRLQLPKYVINAAGDQYFHPDTSQFYWDEMPEEKSLRYVPNADHSLGGSDVIQTMIAFYQMIISDTPRPSYEWSVRDDGAIVVSSPDNPTEVRLWQAHNPEARDFRVESLGRAYESTVLTPEADGTYVAPISAPEQGFQASFVELTFDTPSGQPFKVTTGVSITPNTFPFKWEDAAEQYADTLGGENLD